MPSDPQKWQACGFGLRNYDDRIAIQGCHADRHRTEARKFLSRAQCEAIVVTALDAIESDLSHALRQRYARDKDGFARRVWLLVMPWQCERAEKVCAGCMRTHLKGVLTAQHPVFSRLEPPVTHGVTSILAGASKRVAAVPIEAADGGAKRLRSAATDAAQAAEDADREAVQRYLVRVELAATRDCTASGDYTACTDGAAAHQLVRAAALLRAHLHEGAPGAHESVDRDSVVADLRAPVAGLRAEARAKQKDVVGKQAKRLVEARDDRDSNAALVEQLREQLAHEKRQRVEAERAAETQRRLCEAAEQGLRAAQEAAERGLRAAQREHTKVHSASEPSAEPDPPPASKVLRSLEGVTISLKDRLPSQRWGFAMRWQVVLVYMNTFAGVSTTKCVLLLVFILSAAGAEVQDVPKEASHEGMVKTYLWQAKEFVQDRLALDLHRLRDPTFIAPAEPVVLPDAEGALANHRSTHRYAQEGSVACGPGFKAMIDWLKAGGPSLAGDLTDIPAQGLFPPAERDSTAGRAAWSRRECLGVFIKEDGTTKMNGSGQEVLLIGGVGLTVRGETRSLRIDRHHGQSGGCGVCVSILLAVVEVRQRQLRLGVPEDQLFDLEDILVLGTDNTNYCASEFAGTIAILAQVRVPLVLYCASVCVLYCATKYSLVLVLVQQRIQYSAGVSTKILSAVVYGGVPWY